jgi:hypothetical protein
MLEQHERMQDAARMFLAFYILQLLSGIAGRKGSSGVVIPLCAAHTDLYVACVQHTRYALSLGRVMGSFKG